MEQNSTKPTILILGAGLCGLTLRHLLSELNLKPVVLEARNRVGGRIHTLNSNPTIEMGATWFSQKHTNVVTLLEKLNLHYFPERNEHYAHFQQAPGANIQLFELPNQSEPSYRIENGSANLINKLIDAGEGEILLQHAVKSIEFKEDHYSVSTDSKTFQADILINTIPPNLFVHSIQVTPKLPSSFVSIAKQTHTWMGESIKFGITYLHPFWQKSNNSGTFFSNAGPIIEMYDHSNLSNQEHALKGFLHPNLFQHSEENRRKIVIEQLVHIYGLEAATPLLYEESIWRNNAFTYHEYDSEPIPHANNGQPELRESFHSSHFINAGSETAIKFPGYMDGAIESAYITLSAISNLLS